MASNCKTCYILIRAFASFVKSLADDTDDTKTDKEVPNKCVSCGKLLTTREIEKISVSDKGRYECNSCNLQFESPMGY